MKDEGLVVHSDPEILSGTPVFLEPACRCDVPLSVDSKCS
jgi:hypothetical protein